MAYAKKTEYLNVMTRVNMLEEAIASHADWKWARPEEVTEDFKAAKEEVQSFLKGSKFAQTFILVDKSQFVKSGYTDIEREKGYENINAEFGNVLKNLMDEMSCLLRMHAARKAEREKKEMSKKGVVVKIENNAEAC